MAGISDKALKTQYAENKYRANGGDELQNKEFSDGSGLEMYDATFRMYDPQIGRFWQTDPLGIVTADYSPYSFSLDNPILFNDPLGLLSDSANPQELAPVTVTHAFNPLPTQHTAVTAQVADTKGGGPDVSGSIGAAPTNAAGPTVATTDQRTLFEKFDQNETIGHILDAINTFNPLAQGWDLGLTIFTGHEHHGIKQSTGQAALKFAATIPIGRAATGIEVGVSLLELGLGNTGRTEAVNLTEQLAMEEIKTNPALGAKIIGMKAISDPRWKGWVKMTNLNAHGVEIHFNALFKDGVMTAVDDFKFK